MPTPISATSPYCSAQQLIQHCDARRIQDLVQDAGVKVPYTTVALSSDGVALSTMAFTINVVATSGVAGTFPASGTVPLATTAGDLATIAYTGITATAFTGCTTATVGTMHVNDPVSLLLTDGNVAEALLCAAGLIESTCLTGNRYKVADLQALTGASKALLRRLNAGLAEQELTWRRNPTAELLPKAVVAYEWLERARLGEAIFGLQEVADAGAGVDATPMTPMMIEALGLNTFTAERYYGIRNQTIRRFRSGQRPE